MKNLKLTAISKAVETRRYEGMNYGVYAYAQFIGETNRLDSAIQMAEDNWDLSELRIVEYSTSTAYEF